MRKVYLHIGTEKTGTTAFQRNLQNNVANLELNNIKLYTDLAEKIFEEFRLRFRMKIWLMTT